MFSRFRFSRPLYAFASRCYSLATYIFQVLHPLIHSFCAMPVIVHCHGRALLKPVTEDASLPFVVLWIRQGPNLHRLADAHGVFTGSGCDGSWGECVGAGVLRQWHRTVLVTTPICLCKNSCNSCVERCSFATLIAIPTEKASA